MCNLEPKLVAWLDGEVSQEVAEQVERHLAECGDCRGQLARYKDVGRGFAAYCEAIVGENAPNKKHRWAVPALALVAAAVALFVFARTRPETIVETPAALTASIAAVEKNEIKPASVKPIRNAHRSAPKAIEKRAQNWRPTGGAVQIAIPAESMFAPGAMPQGMNFIAELRIAPDGSVEQVVLRQ